MNSEKNCFPNRYVHAPNELPSEFKQTQIQGYRQERFTMECIREVQRIKGAQHDMDSLCTSVDRYIRQHFEQPLTVRQIADDLHISYAYLSHHYRNTTGRTIKESIMETKCATAKILLKTTEMPISSISVSLGFSSQNHFQQVFQKMTGKTPRQFRRN